jgi:hypothetical protein
VSTAEVLHDYVADPTGPISADSPAPAGAPGRRAILDPGLDLTLRPMRYPEFYERYRAAVRNTWTVEEIDFSDDVVDINRALLPAEKHLIRRLVAFFATGDSIVANNLVLNLYKHINAPEARLFLSRQLYEEALHVQFYLTLLDTYLPDPEERAEAFRAVETIPSIKAKAEFCFRWMSSIGALDELRTREDRRTFLLNLVCFAACIEGLFFFGAFAYVYFLRSKGLLNGLAAGTNWVFRDESGHMDFAFAVVDTVRREEPVRVHGAAGRPGALELLRADRVVLPGWRHRRRRLRRRLLTRPEYRSSPEYRTPRIRALDPRVTSGRPKPRDTVLLPSVPWSGAHDNDGGSAASRHRGLAGHPGEPPTLGCE